MVKMCNNTQSKYKGVKNDKKKKSTSNFNNSKYNYY